MSTPNRNDPCPCGSGKKYKKCCLGNTAAATLNLVTSPAKSGSNGADPAGMQTAPELLARAVALHQAGHLDAAISDYRQALSLKPGSAEAHNNLGFALQTQGKLQEAMTSYRKAISIKPDFAGAHSNLGLALQVSGKLEDAVVSLNRALALDPNLADAHYNLGITLRIQGKLEQAIACYRRAIAIEPSFAEAHYNLGNALQEQGRFDDAIISHRKAISFKADYADAYCNLGAALRSQGQLDEAIANLQHALLLKPDLAEIHTNLAATYIDLGRFDAARLALSRALESRAEHPNAWAMLTTLQKMTPEDDGWLNTALRLASGPISLSEKIPLQFAIGKFYDDTKQYDLAFSAFRQANTLKRSAEGKFDRIGFSRLIDGLIATYNSDLMHRPLAGASSSSLPVLIVGMPRSGTSLVEQIIASHPGAYGAGELTFWGNWLAANQSAILSGNLGENLVTTSTAAYEQYLRRHSANALRIVDKMPGNFILAGLIHLLFPQAKIIHTRRNPIDTCLSVYFQNLVPAHSYGTDMDDLAFYYLEYDRLMRHWREVLPADRFLEISYEELTDNQAEWSRRVIEFIGLEWDERCLDFHTTERKVGTWSNWQVRQKIYHSSKARWHNYEKHLGPLLGLIDLDIPRSMSGATQSQKMN